MVPTKKQIDSGSYKLIGGVWHKICKGPSHDEPTYLPATPKYFYFLNKGPRALRPIARCRLCHHWARLKNPGQLQGLVPVADVAPFYVEVVNRIGMTELHKRSGLSLNHINGVLSRSYKHVRRAQVRRLMLELVSIHRKKEYSINSQARWRAERRNNTGMETCPKCGTPKNNYTRGCPSCRARLYDRHRKGGMPTEEYDRIRRELLDDEAA